VPVFLLGLGFGDDPAETVPLALLVLSGLIPLGLGAGVCAATKLGGVAGLVADAGLPGVAHAVAHAPKGLGIGIKPCCR